MAAKRTKSVRTPKSFTGKNGFDIMRGRVPRTRPSTLKPPYIPGTGMGVGMSEPL